MKFNNKVICLLSLLAILGAGCDEYLDETPEATISEDYIFANYKGFQGFIDECYTFMIDYWGENEGSTLIFSNEGTYNQVASTGNAQRGNYWWLISPSNQAPYDTGNNRGYGDKRRGIWRGSWYGIRQVNLALEKLPMLVDATQEERDKIVGQAYFFRAWYYWEIIRSFGGMPYVDKYLGPNDDLNIPRLTFQETVERMVEDYDKAIALLPVSWAKGTDLHEVGRVTKGAAHAFKAKALLYAGSPLMVNESTGTGYIFDTDYMKRAAKAAYEVIKLADQGVYKLLPISKGSTNVNEYNDQFARNDGFQCYTEETIFMEFLDANRNFRNFGSSILGSVINRNYLVQRLEAGGARAGNVTPSQDLVDMFEMQASGLPIDDPDSGFDPMNPWEGRDPRLRNGILVDRDQWTVKQAAAQALQFYKGGRDDNSTNPTPYAFKKLWPKTVNKFDNQIAQYREACPHMRLASAYLIYAEAMNEAYGPNGTDSGLPLSAVGAINILRDRPMSADDPSVPIMPPVNSKFTSDKEVFRERIHNEMEVELYFEGDRWFDLRRWHEAHLEKNRQIHGLEFDKNWTYFNKTLFRTIVFEERHYWMPIPLDQTQLYSGFYQNPGW